MAKKITIAAGSFWPEIGGPSSYLKAILPKIKESGFRIDLVARSKKSRYPEDAALDYGIHPVKSAEGGTAKQQFDGIHRLKDWPGKPVNYLRYFLKLLKVAKSSDIIYAQGPVSSGYPSYLANKFLKKKFVVKITGDYAWENYSLKNEIIDVSEFQNKKISGKFHTLRKIQMKVCQTADKIIVPSKFLAKVVTYWGVKDENIEVIYNGIDPERSREGPSRTNSFVRDPQRASASYGIDFKPLAGGKEKARKEIGISGNIILSVGRLVPWKGFKMLIKIMPELIKEYNFARLVIVGDGPDREILETMKNNLGLQNKVYLVGKKSPEELKTYLAASDMFVLNTAYEGFSHQLLEAMAAGAPVVTTNAGGNPELIKQGENGFMVLYNDELNLTEAIKAVFDHEDIREKFIEQGKKTAEKFTVQKMADETIEVFNSLIHS